MVAVQCMMDLEEYEMSKGKRNKPIGKINSSIEKLENEENEIAIAKSKIQRVMGRMCNFLLMKNASYGNSVLNPLRLFSKADDYEQLMVRIDDKLSRLERGNFDHEDRVELHKDLMGYHALVLVKLGFGDEECDSQ